MLRECANVCSPPRRVSVTANSKNHPTQQSAAALPIKRYAAACGVEAERKQAEVETILHRGPDPDLPPPSDMNARPYTHLPLRFLITLNAQRHRCHYSNTACRLGLESYRSEIGTHRLHRSGSRKNASWSWCCRSYQE